NAPLVGSKISAVSAAPLWPAPPASSTLPSDKTVAVWLRRGITKAGAQFGGGVGFVPPTQLNVPLEGAYNSAVGTKPCPGFKPPAIRTSPLPSGLAVCRSRASFRSPVGVKLRGGSVVVVVVVVVDVAPPHGLGEHVPGPLSMPPLFRHACGVFSWHVAV